MTIGERIAAFRKERRWTQRTLALLTGYTGKTVIAWEKGMHKPSERAIRALEKAFGQQLRK